MSAYKRQISRVFRRRRDVFSMLSNDEFVESFRLSKEAKREVCLAVERNFVKRAYCRRPECCCFFRATLDVAGKAIMLSCFPIFL